MCQPVSHHGTSTAPTPPVTANHATLATTALGLRRSHTSVSRRYRLCHQPCHPGSMRAASEANTATQPTNTSRTIA